MNAIVPQQFGTLAPSLQGQALDNELGAGISAGFSLIGYRGKVWSIRHRGEEFPLMRDDNDGPRGSIEIVILKASTVLSKIFYEKGYVEGTDAPPDCFSTNGLTPDPASPKKQATVCAGCPMNIFGTAKRQDGSAGKGKACTDVKRLAVAPLASIMDLNEALGGPMLLRVPPSSLGDIANYGDGLKKMGYPPYGVATRISFDAKEAYPKFVFAPIRALTEDEVKKVLELRADTRTDRILAADAPAAALPPAQEKPQLQFEQPPASPPPHAAAPATVPATPAPQPVTAPVAASPAPAGAGVTPPPPPAPPKRTRATTKPAEAAPAAPTAQSAPAPAQGGAAVMAAFGGAAPAQPAQAAPAPEAAPAVVGDMDFDAKLEALMGKSA